jgi:hypothetical protein
MLKRWKALPRNTRWRVGGIAAVVLALAVVWALFVPAADWLAHHDVGTSTGSLHETALDNARGRLLTLGAGLFAAGALVFTVRNFTLSREGQVTDRFTKAIEQLGSDKLDVRIGGIYALERIARDSAKDFPTVMVVLNVFIREHSHDQWPLPEHKGDPAPSRRTRPDVQAALRVIGHRDPTGDIRVFDLTSAILIHANLDGLNLTSSRSPNVKYAEKHQKAWFGGADFTDATVKGAILADVHLKGANFTRAKLNHTNLRDANLKYAIFTGADLSKADLAGADLTGAKLAGAKLVGARWPADAPVPEGWKLDPGSGRLERAGADSGPTDQNGGSSE